MKWQRRNADVVEQQTSHGTYLMHRVNCPEEDAPRGWYFLPPDVGFPGYYLAFKFRDAWRQLDRRLINDLGHRVRERTP